MLLLPDDGLLRGLHEPRERIRSNQTSPNYQSTRARGGNGTQIRASHHVIELDAEIEAERLEFVLGCANHGKATRLVRSSSEGVGVGREALTVDPAEFGEKAVAADAHRRHRGRLRRCVRLLAAGRASLET